MRLSLLVLSAIGAVLCFSTSNCYYDSIEAYYQGTNTCDTLAVQYSIQVQAILRDNCNICHGGDAISGGGHKMDNYQDLLNYVNSGTLLDRITAADTGPKMPPLPNSPLNDCDIDRIQAWINDGAPDN